MEDGYHVGPRTCIRSTMVSMYKKYLNNKLANVLLKRNDDIKSMTIRIHGTGMTLTIDGTTARLLFILCLIIYF